MHEKFVVYGDYDTVVNDDGASRFLARFTHSPLRWRLRIDDGTHVMHLEQNRRSLYASVNAFIHAVESLSPCNMPASCPAHSPASY